MEKLRRLSFHFVRIEILVHVPEDGQMCPVTIRPMDTIKELRVHLVKQGVTSWKKHFSYNGRELGEYETIKDLNIKSGAVLLLVKNRASNNT
ncbi:TINCR ubiquitin domain containing [Gastrophryne carolinensis]